MVEISDPSDWLGSPCELLGHVDSALRCQVCKEFFQTPMITTCSHTFCSLCIRRCLSEDGKCPTCRTQETVSKLRRNVVVEEVVEAFVAARPSALRLAMAVNPPSQGQKRKLHEVSDSNEPKIQRQTRSQGRSQGPNHRRCKSEDQIEASPKSGDNSELEDGYSRCPICQKKMRTEAVYGHIDTSCTPTNEDKEGDSRRPQRNLYNAQPRMDLAPLAHINYSILNETSLRKKVTSLGLPAHGSKLALQRRHAEFVNIWNANCDASNPKSKRQLVNDLSLWERSQNNQPVNSVMNKDFDGQSWSSAHDNDFKQLVLQAHETRRGNVTASASDKEGSPDARHAAARSTELENTELSSSLCDVGTIKLHHRRTS